MEKIAVFLGRCAIRTFFICALMCQSSFIICDEQQEESAVQQEEVAIPQEELNASREEVVAPQENSDEEVAPQQDEDAISQAEEVIEQAQEEIAKIAVPLTEELMRDNGILRRILLIYEEIMRRIDSHTPFAVADVLATANIVKGFVEGYEALKSQYLFPIFETSGTQVPLINALREQHAKARKITARLQEMSSPTRPTTPATRTTIRSLLKKFIVMYRPHLALEDTILLPEVRNLVTADEFNALSQRLEEAKGELLGEAGLGGILNAVADLETRLGIFDINQFTPAETNK